jgi:predicted ester cyclase
MSTTDLKTLERRFWSEWNKGKAAAMAIMNEIYAADLVFYGGSGRVFHGLEDFKQYQSVFFDAFPDNQASIDDLLVVGDKAVLRYTMSGTHKGEFMGIPPTNKKLTMWIIEIDRFAGGKIVEGWDRYDTLGIMQQLGVLPTPGKPK